jgi:uncharacterized protein YbjT (DUF2867 family)
MYLVTGATGNVGSELVRILLADDLPVRALSRSGERRSVPPEVDIAAGDLNSPAGLGAALDGVTGVFLLPGYSDMPGLLGAIAAHGADRVVLLSGGSAGSRDMSNAVTAYMVRSEDAVTAAGLPWTILRPTAFMSNALRWKPQLDRGDTLRLPFANVRTACVDPHDIAAVAAVALRTDGHDGKVYVPTGPQALLPAEQAEILGAVLDRRLDVSAQPDEEARAEMLRSTPPEYVDAFFDFYVGGALDESRVLPTVRDVTGREPGDFAGWARRHAHDFRAPPNS